MKLTSILAVSVCLNLVLIGVVLTQNKKSPAPREETPVPASTDGTLSAAPAPGSGKFLAKGPSQAFDWRRVESGDYRQYIENLRSIGCPEETIRDIIVADVNKMFESRKRDRLKSADDFQFWKTGGTQLFAAPDPAKLDEETKQRRELAAEKRALIKELLGIDIPEKPENLLFQADPMDKMLGFLSSEKRNQLMELEQKFAAKRAAPGSTAVPGDFAGIKKFEAEKKAELARILSPEELEEYHLRVSPTAMTLRRELDGFEPTEQEFRDLFRLKQKFDEEFGPLSGFNGFDPVVAEKRAASQAELEEQIRQAMGESRYVEYQRAQDWAYKGALHAAEQNGLGKEAAVKVYELKALAEEQARQFRTDQSLTVEQQLEAMAMIRAEAERAVAEILGEKGFEAYQAQGGGSWLRALHPGLASQ
jgi:hypothetical protein